MTRSSKFDWTENELQEELARLRMKLKDGSITWREALEVQELNKALSDIKSVKPTHTDDI